MFEELNIFFNSMINYDVVSENNKSAKVRISDRTLKNIGFENILKFNSGTIIKPLRIETNNASNNNSFLLDKYLNNQLEKEDFNQMISIDFVIEKSNINLEKHEIFYVDLKKFIDGKFNCNNLYSVVYNVERDVMGAINFVKISNKNFMKNRPENKIQDITDYRSYIKNMDYTTDELTLNIYNYIDYVTIISTFAFITELEQIDDSIELKGDKHININNITPSNCSLKNETRNILKKLNSHLNSEDLHVYDKNKILIRVLSIYLNDNSNLKDFIEKIEKIYVKTSDSIENYINKNVDNYFDNHNKLLEEVINTCNKITDVTNRSITQLLSVITGILASLFFYVYKKQDLDSILFTTIIIIFILLVGFIIVLHHSYNYIYYKNFLIKYFNVIDNIYSFKESEILINSNLISPALKRYKNTILRISILLFLFIFIGILIIINIYLASIGYFVKLLFESLL